MVAPAIVAAGLAAAGGIAQNYLGSSAANKQMKFQKKTLQHQYQWGMEDMRKAGLNPILAYKQGGAGSASGSSYTPQNVGSAAVQGGSTAASTAMQLNRQETELANIAADTGLKGKQQATQAALALQAETAAANNAANTAQTQAQTNIVRQNIHSAKAQAALAKTDEIINKSTAGTWLRYYERFLGRPSVSVNAPFSAQALGGKKSRFGPRRKRKGR